MPGLVEGQKGTRREIVPNLIKRRPVTFFQLDHPIAGSTEHKAPAIDGYYDIQSNCKG